VGRQRGAGLGGGHDEREQTLNQLLVEMDGFESNEGVILIAATNRPDVLDPALLRPGRFDRQVVVSTPDLRGRQRILDVHTRRTPLADDVNTEVLAKGTPGFSGADLENLVNEAALQAAKQNKNQVNMVDFEYAKDKVLMGKERRSLILSDEEKKITAYHEAGHALVNMLTPHTKGTVHKVSIIPRGRAGGYTLVLPKEDRYYATKTELLQEIKTFLGGRVAEELVLGEISTGAQNDLERSTELVRKMITVYGMSENLGPITFGKSSEQQVFLGRDISRERNYSEEVAYAIDKEVRSFVEDAYKKTQELLKENLEKLHLIAQALLERETLEGEEVEQLIKEGKITEKPLTESTAPKEDSTAAVPETLSLPLNEATGEQQEQPVKIVYSFGLSR
jgi:cell division protease FtsH